jgi:DNA-binding transcriptional MerR regulator
LHSDHVIDHGYPIGEAAALAHVTVRTLHHYDEIGLLRPSGRTSAGHRRYSRDDLQRLREILFYRELDFGLDEIAAMLADPGAGTATHLRDQHRMLRDRIDRHQQASRTRIDPPFPSGCPRFPAFTHREARTTREEEAPIYPATDSRAATKARTQVSTSASE